MHTFLCIYVVKVVDFLSIKTTVHKKLFTILRNEILEYLSCHKTINLVNYVPDEQNTEETSNKTKRHYYVIFNYFIYTKDGNQFFIII